MVIELIKLKQVKGRVPNTFHKFLSDHTWTSVEEIVLNDKINDEEALQSYFFIWEELTSKLNEEVF